MNQEIPEYVQQDFSAITMIIYHLEEGIIPYDIEGIARILEKYPKYGLGINIEVRKRAYEVLKWVMEHPETDFQKLNAWHVRDNESYFQKMRTLYDTMTEYGFYKDRTQEDQD
jgi:hypothetical protein